MFSFLLWEFNFTSDQGRMVEKCKWPGHKNQTFKAPALINDIFMEMSPQNYNNKKGHVLHVMLSFEFLFLVVDKWPISGRSSEADQLRLFWESGWNNLSTCFLVNYHSELSISSGLDCPKQSWLKWTVLKKSISIRLIQYQTYLSNRRNTQDTKIWYIWPVHKYIFHNKVW